MKKFGILLCAIPLITLALLLPILFSVSEAPSGATPEDSETVSAAADRAESGADVNPTRLSHAIARWADEDGKTCSCSAYRIPIVPRARHLISMLTLNRVSTEAVRGELTVGFADGARRLEILKNHGLKELRHDAVLGFSRVACDPDHLPETLAALSETPGVRYAEPNIVARAALVPNDALHPIADGIKGIETEQAWDTTTGSQNVTIAVVDTGVDPNHGDLQANLLSGFDFVNNGTNTTDDNGHGTAIAGLIGAIGDNQTGISGVAPGCRILPVKVADADGFGSMTDLASGIRWAVDNGAQVVNVSMGARVPAQVLKDAVDYAETKGVLVVAAAGNDNVNYEMYPANYANVVSVGSGGNGAEISHNTVLSSTLDVVAPGEGLITTLPGSLYGYVNGTSAACAVTSGVVALALSVDPTLSRTHLETIVRAAQDPIPLLNPVRRVFPVGKLNARKAVERASTSYVDLAVRDVQVFPSNPQPGTQATIRVTVRNEGQTTQQNVIVKSKYNGIENAPASISSLAPGGEQVLDFSWSVPAGQQTYTLEGVVQTQTNETETADNTLAVNGVQTASGQTEALTLTGIRISPPDVAQNSITIEVDVENRGSASASNLPVDVTVAGTALATQTLSSVGVGQKGTATFTWTIPNPAPTGIVEIAASTPALPSEAVAFDNSGTFEFILGSGSGRPVQGLYQQSNGVDIFGEAPKRVVPNRPYVPVCMFVASKGGRKTNTKLTVDRARVIVQDSPGAGAAQNVVYEDETGGSAPRMAQGTEVFDEMGNRITGGSIFKDDELVRNGRHQIVRVPRQAVGVSGTPAQPETKYLDVEIQWKTKRKLLWVFSVTRQGAHRRMNQVTFTSDEKPSLPGEGHHYDVHHHTIAEWYFSSPIDIFAPRKAYGGPIQMVREAAYAQGMIDSPNDIWGKVITTDHSGFYNTTINDPDHPDHRPPFGWTAPQNSVDPSTGRTRTEHEQYRHLFGPAAGEEVAFKQGQGAAPMKNLPFLDPLLAKLTVPIGAHMLVYKAEHIEGPWHGGGWIPNSVNPPAVKEVILHDTLKRLAKNNQTENRDAFVYAAHPFSGQGWNDTNIDRTIGLSQSNRTRDYVHDQTDEFLFKGWQVFNGRGNRSLPKTQIDFRDLNPWTDPDFQKGDADWDHVIQLGLDRWHGMISDLLKFHFQSDTSHEFIRKVYIAGGSDAHGDFNFSDGRVATPLSLQSTYSVDNNFFGAVTTYVQSDGKSGQTEVDRYLNAYADGNTIVGDGPLLRVSLDAQGRFDSETLTWHDQAVNHENEDGRIGGDGAFDGGYTALVERGSGAPIFRYRYTNASHLGSNGGDVASLKIYKDTASTPNPTRQRGSFQQIVGVGELAPIGPDQDLTQPLNPTAEGVVNEPTAFSFGAFTGGDPDQTNLGVDEYRCFTNPVYVVPVDIDIQANPDLQAGVIPAGGLTATYTFDLSMDPRPYDIEVKMLDANGDSSGAVLETMTGTWSAVGGIDDREYTVTNQTDIQLSGVGYPDPAHLTFVVYWKDAPRDMHGNALNSIAKLFVTDNVNPVTAGTGSGSTGGSTGSTAGSASGSGTSTPRYPPPGTSWNSGSSCALKTGRRSPTSPWILLALFGLAVAAIRRRRTAK